MRNATSTDRRDKAVTYRISPCLENIVAIEESAHAGRDVEGEQ